MPIKKLSKKLFYLLLPWFVIHSSVIIIDGLSKPKNAADYAVILGNKVNDDGTLSIRLEKRLECGLQLYKTARVKGIIVSGGLGKEGYYEGDEMKKYLVQKGIPDSVIIIDNVGNNTRLSVTNVLNLQTQLHFKSIIVVSQYFHISRTKMLFRKNGFTAIESASPDYFEWHDLYSMIREFFAFYLQLF